MLARFDQPHLDWLKCDTQGTDLRLFKSLSPDRQSRVLALDVEPGLIDAYQGEDLFIDTHRDLTQNGFWLANLKVLNTVRMQRFTFEAAISPLAKVRHQAIWAGPGSPGWCEVRYLRTLESLVDAGADQRSYLLLWVLCLDEASFRILE